MNTNPATSCGSCGSSRRASAIFVSGPSAISSSSPGWARASRTIALAACSSSCSSAPAGTAGTSGCCAPRVPRSVVSPSPSLPWNGGSPGAVGVMRALCAPLNTGTAPTLPWAAFTAATLRSTSPRSALPCTQVMPRSTISPRLCLLKATSRPVASSTPQSVSITTGAPRRACQGGAAIRLPFLRK